MQKFLVQKYDFFFIAGGSYVVPISTSQMFALNLTAMNVSVLCPSRLEGPKKFLDSLVDV